MLSVRTSDRARCGGAGGCAGWWREQTVGRLCPCGGSRRFNVVARGAVRVDTIVHLAARVHVMNDDAADPLAAFRQVNVAATLNLARQAVSAGVRRLVFVSTVKVNGEHTAPVGFRGA